MTVKTQNYAFKIKTRKARNACDYCDSQEGQTCPIGGYKVQIRTLHIGGSKKSVCQSCLHEHFNVMAEDSKKRDIRLGLWQKLVGAKRRNYLTT